MDLHEWELLSNEAFVDLHEDDDDQKVNNSLKTTTLVDMDYFHDKLSRPKNKRGLRVIPVQIKFDQEEKFEEEIPKEVIKSSQESDDDDKDQNFDEQEMISKVFFKKLKENDQFVDMKMDSPKSLNRGIMPQIDVGTYQFVAKDDKDGNFEKESVEKDDKVVIYEEKKVKKEGKDGEKEGVNIWKWAMTGMGALVTFGFAAATLTLIVLSNKQSENHSKMQELHFQIYSHDKRFKQVVRRAKKLNEAISVMRGAPMTRAHITIGGYNESL